MGASSTDINLSITSNNKTAYYSSVKGCGHLIWNRKFGLFQDKKPDPFTILNFTKGTNWEDCIDVLTEPLENPIYGSVSINFDTKEIIDCNGYGKSIVMFFDWFIYSIFDASNKKDNTIIPALSLKEHLQHNRLIVLNRFYENTGIILPNTIKKNKEWLNNLGIIEKYQSYLKINEQQVSWISLTIPKDWTYVCKDYRN